MVTIRVPSTRSERTANRRRPGWRRGAVGLLVVATVACTWAAAADDKLDFFESKVRPLLASRCYKCHSADKGKTHGGLSLDSRDGWQTGGDSGPPVLPEKPDESLLIQAVRYRDDGLQMPPEEAGGKLSADEIEILTQWVKMGAPDPRETKHRASAMTPDEAQTWWAFQPLRTVPPPAIVDRRQVRNRIDEFLQAPLERLGLAPLAAADKRTLLRRATFDLIGLPPTPEEVAEFLRDDSPDAFAKVVERLLASPHYGERWGRHWLDLVRYADYFQENPREHPQADRWEIFEAWRYRDWVVEAFNRDLPFDEFVVHQIAGDRLAAPAGPPYADGLVATTVLAIGAWDNADADKQHIISDIVDDQINLIGQSFLGLTLACARCHDHKFDPITTEDYYGLAGIFYSTHVLSRLGEQGGHTALLRTPLAPADYLERRRLQLARLGELDAELAKLQPAPQPPPVAGAAAPPTVVPEPATAPPAAQTVAAVARLQADRTALQAELLPEPALAIAAQDGGTPGGLFPEIQDVPVHVQGSHNKLGNVVSRRFPLVLAGTNQPPISTGSGRLELARWIASSSNPLTPRVMANRIWQWHFGEGLARTASNFGKLGDRPRNPELLDWLAGEFVKSGWSVKAMHRLIMNSAAYGRASASGGLDTQQARLFELDPENRLLARFEPRRLDAECLRDAMLAVGGKLDRARGGPAALELSLPRRSLYIQTTRWTRAYFSSLFDAADPEQLVDRRSVSTVAPQALFFMNHPFVSAISQQVSGRLLSEAADNTSRVQRVYELFFARLPDSAEAQLAVDFFERNAWRGVDASWTDFVQILLASNEFAYVD